MSSDNLKNTANRLIDEELVSVDALKHVLSICCGYKLIHINREQNDPPDFTVLIDGEPFPVEVTSIVSYQQYHSHIDEFTRAIRKSSSSLGILSGKYILKISRLPRIPIPRSNNGLQLINAAVKYIDATQKQVTYPNVKLAQDTSGKISIGKVSDNGSIVSSLWFPPFMWENETQSQLAALIQNAINNKRSKLQNAGISSSRAILLLYDAFGYAQPRDAVTAMQQVNGYEWFHSVFWVASFLDRKNTSYPEEPGRDGIFLYSNNPSWHHVGTVPLENGT